MPRQIGELILYDLQELSGRLGLTVFSLREYVKKGKIRARKLGNKYFVTQEALNEYFNNHSATSFSTLREG